FIHRSSLPPSHHISYYSARASSSAAVSCSLSLRCYGAPLYLHSFPTRRSSDLRELVEHLQGRDVTVLLAAVPPRHEAALARSTRSEEHTSELQSRENLVCRLLLEKKKNISHT